MKWRMRITQDYCDVAVLYYNDMTLNVELCESPSLLEVIETLVHDGIETITSFDVTWTTISNTNFPWKLAKYIQQFEMQYIIQVD